MFEEEIETPYLQNWILDWPKLSIKQRIQLCHLIAMFSIENKVEIRHFPLFWLGLWAYLKITWFFLTTGLEIFLGRA